MKKLLLCTTAALLSQFAALHAAELKLAALFTDHAVLQRDQLMPVWGWANPGEEITVTFARSTPSTGSGQAGSGQAAQKKTARADASGKWMVKLDPLPASADPHELTVQSAATTLTRTDVLVGDVWVCSGQSNMAMNMHEALNPTEEIANAQFPGIRLFTVKQTPAVEPAADVEGAWATCTPRTAAGFSAAGYFFGRELHRDLNVPIGLLLSAVGSTRAEGWTRLDVLRTVPIWADRAEKEIAQIKTQEEESKNFPVAREAWEKKYGVSPPPVSEEARKWADPALDTSDWKPVTLPARWAELGAKTGGVFWVRKEVTLPESAAGKTIRLSLDWILEQYDTAFFNGVEVGRLKDQPPTFYNVQRGYWIPANLVKAGRNVIAVRVVSASEGSGMGVSNNVLGLPPTNPGSNDRQWVMKTESSFPALTAEAIKTRPKPNTLPFREVSSSLYNGMIAPLIPYGIKGALWYQGEGNASRATEYRELLSQMIRDWRAQWGQGDFPFLIQQLVNNGPAIQDPNKPDNWMIIREAQMQTAETVPNCGIAIGIEIGSAYNLHPPNKQDIGKRLALIALEKTYGKSIESSGPRYASMKIDGAAIRVKFTHAQGLTSKDGPPKNFAIAGADKNLVWADAKIEGDEVVVSSPQAPQPVAVRYAWACNPPQVCNLYNAAGLPMAPFRTDDWK